tara:strand:+ start:1690 stop:2280 length:591 start_codon:yes stop_codon:yes gene_type:complete
MEMEKVSSLDYDDYKEYKREYGKVYNQKNKEKRQEYMKKRLQEDPDYYKKQYQKRKEYSKQYYQKRRENKDWVEEQKVKCNEYKEKNKLTLAEHTAEYKKTFTGKKAHKISEWKRRHGLKETPERCELIFSQWFNSEICELCNQQYKNKNQRCMEHHHPSGHFRYICCVPCNNKLASTDRKKMSVLLELHRYFNII